MGLNFELIKKHPIGVGGGILAAGLLVYFLFLRGGESSGVASDGTTVQERLAAMAYASKAGEQSNQLAIAALQINGQQGLATIQGTFSLKALEDQIAAQTNQNAANNAAALQALSLQEAVALQQLQLGAATQQLQITSAAHVAEVQTQAQLQQTRLIVNASVVQSAQNAQLQEYLANQNAQVQINQANQWANVQINQSNNQRKMANHASDNSLFSSIIGFAAMALL